MKTKNLLPLMILSFAGLLASCSGDDASETTSSRIKPLILKSTAVNLRTAAGFGT